MYNIIVNNYKVEGRGRGEMHSSTHELQKTGIRLYFMLKWVFFFIKIKVQ